jgi:hypothetical protein
MKYTLAWADRETREVKIDYRPVHTYTSPTSCTSS